MVTVFLIKFRDVMPSAHGRHDFSVPFYIGARFTLCQARLEVNLPNANPIS